MVADRKRILVIDDERGPRESLRILLKNEFDVVCAESVDEGVRRLREAAPDAIITDIRMAGKNGIEGLKEIRAVDPLVSVIMLTGFGSLETAQEAIRLGANDYIKKPFDAVEMLNTVRQHAHRTGALRLREKTMADLRELTERLNVELASREHMARLGMASSELVHDMNNPLTAVLGYAELLSDTLRQKPVGNADDAEAVSYIEEIERNVRRCKEMADAWRSLSKGGGRVRERVALAGVVDEVVRSLKPSAGDVALETDWPGAAAAAEVSADRVQIFRAFQNVIHNAVQAVQEQGPGGRVRITARLDGDQVEVRVADTGPGIPADKLNHVFEPFYTTKTGGKGTGLGLCITQKVVWDHGGTIQLESEPGRGTTVVFHLPLMH